MARRARNYRLEDQRQRQVGRCVFSILFDVGALATKPPATGERGRPRTYNNAFVINAVVLLNALGLSLRAVSGLMESVLKQAGIPSTFFIHPSTLCRRRKELNLVLPKKRLENTYLVGDGTGLRLVDEGEYKKLVHGAQPGKPRQYQKVTLVTDGESGEILEVRTHPYTKNISSETDILDQLQRHSIAPGTELLWDGAADTAKAYDKAKALGIRLIAPPAKNAAARSVSFEPKHPRTKAVREIQSICREAWKKKCGYSRRSFIESVNHRFKRLTGSSLNSRTEEAKRADVMARVMFYNRTLQIDSGLLF